MPRFARIQGDGREAVDDRDRERDPVAAAARGGRPGAARRSAASVSAAARPTPIAASAFAGFASRFDCWITPGQAMVAQRSAETVGDGDHSPPPGGRERQREQPVGGDREQRQHGERDRPADEHEHPRRPRAHAGAR